MRSRWGCLLALIAMMIAGSGVAAEPVKVIFDTDMDSDCDDAGALAVLHALADRGEVEIVATTVSSRNEWSPACVAVINGFYGRGQLPVGRPIGRGPNIASKYARGLAQRAGRTTPGLDEFPDAVEVWRQTLAQQTDGSVTLITVGYLTNVAALLEAPAREGEPRGAELARRKINHWVCMGGNFVGHPPVDDLKLGNNNFTHDKQAALRAVREWPGRLTFVGREIGSVPSGLAVGVRLKQLPEENPIRLAYALYFGGEPKNRHVADQTTVLYAVRGLGDRWNIEERGAMDLAADMTFAWRPDDPRPHAYLQKRTVDGRPDDRVFDRAIEREIDELMLAPPGTAIR